MSSKKRIVLSDSSEDEEGKQQKVQKLELLSDGLSKPAEKAVVKHQVSWREFAYPFSLICFFLNRSTRLQHQSSSVVQSSKKWLKPKPNRRRSPAQMWNGSMIFLSLVLQLTSNIEIKLCFVIILIAIVGK